MELMENVLLKDIEPDPNNPRRDFGDLDRLAASFDLNKGNPGEPVNPIVVVRNGAKFRIFDGERRYRAMAKRGRLACCTLVCDDYDEAACAIQMLATNDKMELTEEEKSRGFQQSLLLGADDSDAEAAAGVEKGTAAKVRKARQAVADPELCEQFTIDRLEAISEFADDDAAVEQLSSAKGTEWVGVRNRLRRIADHRTKREALVDAAGRCGIELSEVVPSGWYVRYTAMEAADVGRFNGERGCEGCVAVLRDGDEWNAPRILFYADPDTMPESDEDAARAARRAEIERLEGAYRDAMGIHASHIAGIIRSVGIDRARTQFPAVWSLVYGMVVDGGGYDPCGIRTVLRNLMGFNDAAGSDFDVEWTEGLFCSAFWALLPGIDSYELGHALDAEADDLGVAVSYLPGEIKKALLFAEAFAEDGMEASPDEQRLYAAWRKYEAAYKRKEASDEG